MTWFRNLKIGPKLIMTFSIIIAGLLFSIIYGAISIGSLVKVDKQMYDEDLQSVAIVGDMSREYDQLRVTAIKIVYENFSMKGANELTDALNAAKDGFDKLATEYQKTVTNDGDQKNIDSLKKQIADYNTVIEALIGFIKTNGKAETLRKMPEEATLAAAITGQIDAMKKASLESSKSKEQGNADLGNATILIVAIAGLLMMAFAVIIAAVVIKSITSSINKVVNVANKLAKGDTDISLDIDSTDETGMLARSFKGVVNAVNKLISDTDTLVLAATEGNLSVRADASEHSGEYKKIIDGFNDTLEAIIAPIQETISVLSRVCMNDLTVKVEGAYKGDLKVLVDAVNLTIDRTLATQEVFINLSKGDMSQLAEFEAIGRRSENDMMIPAVVKTMKTLNELTDDANSLSFEAANGNLDVRGDAQRYEGKYNQLIGGINSIIDAIVSPLTEAKAALDAMAQNDFTGSMSEEYKGSFETLSQSINSVIATLNDTLGDINSTSEQVASGTRQVSDGSQALSQGATEQASAIEQLTASLAEIAAQTRQNALNASQASELAVTARDNAAGGNVQMKELQLAMAEINESSSNISKIIKVIDEIAFQTNLLALNAAVEAARAGQHGKGFAVVAEEVRNLAQRSAGAARETTAMIEGSIKKVKAGTKIANETADALNKIVGGVEKVTELVSGIARASSDQATAVAQVNRGIEQVSQVTQTNSATAEESAAASEELSGQAAMLKEMVGRFSLRGQSVAGGQKSSFQPRGEAKALHDGKPGKPRISLNDREFGKY